MDFLKNIQDQFQAMIEDVNLHSAENVNKIMHQIEQAKQYHHFVAECIEVQDQVTSYALSLQDETVQRREQIAKWKPTLTREVLSLRQELKAIKDDVARLPQDTVQIIADVYQAWIYSMNLMDEFSKKTISKLWESNDELGRMIKSQREMLQKKDTEIKQLTHEVEEMRTKLVEANQTIENVKQSCSELQLSKDELVTQVSKNKETIEQLSLEKLELLSRFESLEKQHSDLVKTHERVTREEAMSKLEHERAMAQMNKQWMESQAQCDELRKELGAMQQKHEQWIEDRNEKDVQMNESFKQRQEDERHQLHQLHSMVKELKQNQIQIKGAVQSMQRKYVRTLMINQSDVNHHQAHPSDNDASSAPVSNMNNIRSRGNNSRSDGRGVVTLESILSNMIQQILRTRDARERELRQQIVDMEREYKHTMRQNIQLQRKITDSLAAYRRVYKQLKAKQESSS